MFDPKVPNSFGCLFGNHFVIPSALEFMDIHINMINLVGAFWFRVGKVDHVGIWNQMFRNTNILAKFDKDFFSTY